MVSFIIFIGLYSTTGLDFFVSVTINLIECMQEHNVKNIVFSSSATVYGKFIFTY